MSSVWARGNLLLTVALFVCIMMQQSTINKLAKRVGNLTGVVVEQQLAIDFLIDLRLVE